MPVVIPAPTVIPAKAGIQEDTAGLDSATLDSRLRGNDGERLPVNGYALSSISLFIFIFISVFIFIFIFIFVFIFIFIFIFVFIFICVLCFISIPLRNRILQATPR